MPRPASPVTYHVELTSPHQGGWWEGDVAAYSRDVAILLAGAAASQAGVVVMDDTWVRVERVVPTLAVPGDPSQVIVS